MTRFEVIDSTRYLVEDPAYVFIDDSKIEELVDDWALEDMQIPDWNMPVYPSAKDKETIDFMFLTNTINFAFTDFETKQKFTSDYNGIPWSGAMGMTASLKRALDSGLPILDGQFWRDISLPEMRAIFTGNFEIPMIKERQKILQEVGEVLTAKYDGHFYNLLEASGNRVFNEGLGVVERLVADFPSFDDSVIYHDMKISFNKRAQLAPAVLYGKFEGEMQFEDIFDLTVFADYVLPKGLRDKGALVYETSLASRVDSQKLIEVGSQEELEIRASTIHAADRLIKGINKKRDFIGMPPINALHMDYKLWSESRGKGGHPHHLTKTTAY